LNGKLILSSELEKVIADLERDVDGKEDKKNVGTKSFKK
jgi:hypothetical protein